MKKLTLGSRLTLGGIFIVVVPLVIIGLFAVTKSSNALMDPFQGAGHQRGNEACGHGPGGTHGRAQSDKRTFH